MIGSVMSTNDRPALILGASGMTGRRVAARLWERNVPVRPGGRDAHPPFDWRDRATWPRALEGARAVYVSHPAIDPEAVEAVARRAVDAGAERLVPACRRGGAAADEAEARFHAAAPAGTVLRCSRLAQEFSEGRFVAGVARGEVALGDGGPEPFLDAEDVADVAVAALTEPRHRGRTYELTGPRLLRHADAVAAIAAVLGRPVRLSGEEERPAPGRELSYGVDLALGRPARDFRMFARRAAAAGAWDEPVPAGAA